MLIFSFILVLCSVATQAKEKCKPMGIVSRKIPDILGGFSFVDSQCRGVFEEDTQVHTRRCSLQACMPMTDTWRLRKWRERNTLLKGKLTNHAKCCLSCTFCFVERMMTLPFFWRMTSPCFMPVTGYTKCTTDQSYVDMRCAAWPCCLQVGAIKCIKKEGGVKSYRHREGILSLPDPWTPDSRGQLPSWRPSTRRNTSCLLLRAHLNQLSRQFSEQPGIRWDDTRSY